MAKLNERLIAKLYEVSSNKLFDISECEAGEIWATGGGLFIPVWLAENLEDFKDSSYCTGTGFRVEWLKKRGLVAFLERHSQ